MQFPIAMSECVRIHVCITVPEMWVALCCIKACEHMNVKGAFVNVPVVARVT